MICWNLINHLLKLKVRMICYIVVVHTKILLNLQMSEFSTTVKMNTLIYTFHFLLHKYTANKNDRHDTTEILLTVALNTIIINSKLAVICHHFSSVVRPSTFHILIFSSETTGPIATKLWWNGPWVVPFQSCVRHFIPPTKMATTAELNLT